VVVDADTISLRIPTESQSRTPAALQLAQTGVHPIVVELRIGDRPAGEVTTFLNRLPSVTGTAGPLSVSFVMRQMSLPTIEADGTVSVSDSAHAELAQLRDVLAALDAAPAAAAVDATVPRGVLVEPAVVQALGASDAALAEELLLGLANSDLIATPRLPLDPSAAVRAGQQDRYGQWLLEGEDLLGAIAPIPAIDRSVALVDDRLSRDGAELQRTLGTRMLVLPYDFYTELDGSLLEFTDISQLVTVGLADGTEIPAAIVDDFLGNQMVSGAARPLLTAVEIAAELVVLARDLDIDGAVVDRHGVVLALPDMGIPDPTLMGDLARLLLDTPSTRLVEPRELATTTDLLLNDGRPVMVELPDEAGPDLSSRLEALDDVAADVLAYASMLPSDSPDIARWTQTLDAFPSTAMSDAQVEAAIAQLNDDFERYRSAIIAPEPFSFTLTGRDNLLRVRIVTDSSCDLPQEVVDAHGIRVVPLSIRFGDRGVHRPRGAEHRGVLGEVRDSAARSPRPPPRRPASSSASTASSLAEGADRHRRRRAVRCAVGHDAERRARRPLGRRRHPRHRRRQPQRARSASARSAIACARRAAEGATSRRGRRPRPRPGVTRTRVSGRSTRSRT
jgi:hypothetical protein